MLYNETDSFLLMIMNVQFFQTLTVASIGNTVADMYHATMTQLNLGKKLVKSTEISDEDIIKSLNLALKKDDSISNLGMAFSLAASLDKNVAISVFDRIEDVIVQADEINANLLQFEGDLSLTSTILVGAYALAKKCQKPPPISKESVLKFANYFLTRKNVQKAEEAWHLLNALTILAKNDFHTPVSITLSSTPSVSEINPKVLIQVTDIMGDGLGGMNVQIGN